MVAPCCNKFLFIDHIIDCFCGYSEIIVLGGNNMKVTPKGLLLMAAVETDVCKEEVDRLKFEEFCNRWTQLCLEDHGLDPFDDLCKLSANKAYNEVHRHLINRQSVAFGFIVGIICCLLVNLIKALILG